MEAGADQYMLVSSELLAHISKRYNFINEVRCLILLSLALVLKLLRSALFFPTPFDEERNYANIWDIV